MLTYMHGFEGSMLLDGTNRCQQADTHTDNIQNMYGHWMAEGWRGVGFRVITYAVASTYAHAQLHTGTK